MKDQAQKMTEKMGAGLAKAIKLRGSAKAKNFGGGSKAIIRMQKIKSRAALRGAAAHNSRDADVENANPDLANENTQIGGRTSEIMAKYDELLPDNVRSNAVHACEFLVTASPEAMKKMSVAEQNQFFKDSVEFVGEQIGGMQNILSVSIHRDESTPHAHILAMPLKDGKLNFNHYLGGNKNRLRELQTDFHKQVGENFGVERGAEKSTATHTTIREHYAQLNKGKAAADNAKVGNGDLLRGANHVNKKTRAATADLVNDRNAQKKRAEQAEAQLRRSVPKDLLDKALREQQAADKAYKSMSAANENLKNTVKKLKGENNETRNQRDTAQHEAAQWRDKFTRSQNRQNANRDSADRAAAPAVAAPDTAPSPANSGP